MVAPAGVPKIRFVSPARGAQVGNPAQVVLALGGLATSRPLGSRSVNSTPVKSTAAPSVLERVKVKIDVAYTVTGSLPKDFIIVGGGSDSKHPVKVILSKNKFAPD